jgi:hypothetical protein
MGGELYPPSVLGDMQAERDRLLVIAYDSAVAEYSRAALKLSEARKAPHQNAYYSAYRAAENARRIRDLAYQALVEHRAAERVRT